MKERTESRRFNDRMKRTGPSLIGPPPTNTSNSSLASLEKNQIELTPDYNGIGEHIDRSPMKPGCHIVRKHHGRVKWAIVDVKPTMPDGYSNN